MDCDFVCCSLLTFLEEMTSEQNKTPGKPGANSYTYQDERRSRRIASGHRKTWCLCRRWIRFIRIIAPFYHEWLATVKQVGVYL